MAMALHLKPQFILRRNPNFIIHLFSTSSSSSSNNDDQSNNNNDEQSTNQSPPRSYFSDVKASLKQTPNQSDPSFSFSRSSSQSATLNEIRRNLAQFRLKSAPESSPSPTTSTAGRAVSFQELYRKNMAQKTEDVNNAGAKTVSLDSIRESLKQLRSNHQNQVPNQGKLFNNREFRDSLNTGRFTGGNSTVVRGGSETTLTPPLSFITQEKKKEEGDSSVKNDLVKPYTYVELGEKLRKLRPADSKVIGKNWLSFKELNERLVKLREYEFKEMDAKGVLGSGLGFKDLRESLVKLKNDKTDVDKRKSPQIKLEILSTLGGTETYLRGDPKEHLVEKYFHPDNMSSAEKLKLELKKIRDEFKLSESDCGSSRVQVAQLTVKIKHLSSVLHKKDKHSRKGLQEMVQRRKKLLRYLRRTDWDSYCFCLDKLGLRDNPDYKN